MRVLFLAAGCASMVMTGTAALAGAGANMNACVYLAVPPAQPITFSFTAGGSADHCMNDIGQDASVVASQAGVSCVSVGYVEEKGSSTGGDTCATDTSTWILSYSSSAGGYSGSVQAHMSHPIFSSNHIEIDNASPDTYICSTGHLCNSTKLTWDSGTQGPLYMIFEPGAHN
ncbi:hypothetical protein [Cereibacter johrii]|uniref:hypothetical protein n=1 Tax=Cereibacter johrii TaxID=445629 RepID=UPI002B2607DD|nr:hypothetical protein [Cereibacter johrii]MEA5163388.1 hypothetical protein [Cereibacter johrii]